MGSFGEKLQREREMRGVTLEEIAEATKIGTRSLRALEHNEFDKLPGGIFNKGFVRAYAKYLGLDEEQAVADYLTASGQAEAPATGPLPEVPPTVKLPAQRRRPWLLLALGVLLLAAGWLGWRAYFQTRGARAEESAAASAGSAVESKATPAAAVPAGSETSTAGTPTDTASPSAGTQPSPAAASAPTPAASQPTPSPAASAAAAQPAAAPAEAASAPGFTLDIRAKRDCWIAVMVDGKSQGNHLMKAGSQESLHAKREIVMTVGNAGGLDLVLNGKPLPPQGAEGQKRTLTFTARDAR